MEKEATGQLSGSPHKDTSVQGIKLPATYNIGPAEGKSEGPFHDWVRYKVEAILAVCLIKEKRKLGLGITELV